MVRRALQYGPFLIFLAAMLWATDGPFRVSLLKEVSPTFLVFGEHLVDVVIVLPFLVQRRRALLRLTAKEWLALLVIGVGGSALATLAFTASFAYVNPSVAVLLQKLQPLIAITLAALLLKEKLSHDFWIWALLAIVGAYVISFPKLLPQDPLNPNVIGVALALLAAVLWGASTVLGKYALRAVDADLVLWLRFVIAFAVLAAWNGATGEIAQISHLSAKGWMFLFVVACTSGVGSLWMYYHGLTTTRASVATIAELGYPLAAVAVNAVALQAPLENSQIVGMTILLVAVFCLGRMRTEEAMKTQLQ